MSLPGTPPITPGQARAIYRLYGVSERLIAQLHRTTPGARAYCRGCDDGTCAHCPRIRVRTLRRLRWTRATRTLPGGWTYTGPARDGAVHLRHVPTGIDLTLRLVSMPPCYDATLHPRIRPACAIQCPACSRPARALYLHPDRPMEPILACMRCLHIRLTRNLAHAGPRRIGLLAADAHARAGLTASGRLHRPHSRQPPSLRRQYPALLARHAAVSDASLQAMAAMAALTGGDR